MPSQILIKGFRTRKCFLEEEYSNTGKPLPYKTIYMNIFLKLTPDPKECMSYISDNFIYNKKCNTNIVINNNNNFVLPCVWLWQDGWWYESLMYFPAHCRTTSYRRCTWQHNSDHVFRNIYTHILVNPVKRSIRHCKVQPHTTQNCTYNSNIEERDKVHQLYHYVAVEVSARSIW